MAQAQWAHAERFGSIACNRCNEKNGYPGFVGIQNSIFILGPHQKTHHIGLEPRHRHKFCDKCVASAVHVIVFGKHCAPAVNTSCEGASCMPRSFFTPTHDYNNATASHLSVGAAPQTAWLQRRACLDLLLLLQRTRNVLLPGSLMISVVGEFWSSCYIPTHGCSTA